MVKNSTMRFSKKWPDSLIEMSGTTGAESTWSNGIVEKHNSIISSNMGKVLADVSLV